MPVQFIIDKIHEPLLVFNKNKSKFQSDIVRYKPYSVNDDIETQIRVLYPTSIKKEVGDFIDILKSGNNQWPFYSGINAAFGCSLDFINEEFNTLTLTEDEVIDTIDTSNEDLIIIFSKNFENFWKLKTYTIIRRKRLQFVNISSFHERYSTAADSMKKMYLLNFGVQLYSKANGIPWTLDRNKVNEYEFVREDSIILGLSFGRIGEDIYYGVAQVIDLYGLTIKFEIFNADRVDYSPEVSGYYVPKDEMLKLSERVVKFYERRYKRSLKNIYIYKSSTFLEEEVSGVSESVDDATYYLIHVKTSGLSIRGYDKNEENYTMKRGTVLLYPEKRWCSLWTTGNLEGRKHQLGTPKAIELNVVSNSKENALSLLKHVSFQTLALTKIDWEHANWNVRKPVVFKYSKRAVYAYKYLQKSVQGLDIRDLM